MGGTGWLQEADNTDDSRLLVKSRWTMSSCSRGLLLARLILFRASSKRSAPPRPHNGVSAYLEVNTRETPHRWKLKNAPMF